MTFVLVVDSVALTLLAIPRQVWGNLINVAAVTRAFFLFGQSLATGKSVAFTASGDTLTAVDPNPKEWGSAGLTLTRDLAGGLIGGTWHMTKAVHGNDPPVVPKDPSHYTAQFGADGTLSLLADCNPGRASYSADPPKLHVGPAAITRMMCPPGSLDTIFLRDLSAAATFDIDDGELHVTTKDGLATLTFERVR